MNCLEYDLYLGHLSKHFEKEFFIMHLYTKHFNIKGEFLGNAMYFYLTILGPKVYFSHYFNQSLLESFIINILNSILGVHLQKMGLSSILFKNIRRAHYLTQVTYIW